MARKARFRVCGVEGDRPATLTVERDRGLVSVRLYRSRREYVLPLSWVASAVMWKCVRAEAADRAKAKKASRRRTRR